MIFTFRTGSALFLAVVLPAGAAAQLLSGSDLQLTGVTPSIIYDDTDQAGLEWDLRGRNGFFAIRDLQSNQNAFGITRDGLRIALGYDSSTAGLDSLALGNDASAGDNRALAIGYRASALLSSGIAVGGEASSTGSSGIAVGSIAGAEGDLSVAVGTETLAVGTSSIAIGPFAEASDLANIGIGAFARAVGMNGVAVGQGARANGALSAALGAETTSGGERSVAVGAEADSVGDRSIAVGDESSAGGFAGAALGLRSSAAGGSSIALGRSASAAGNGDIALGFSASTSGSTTAGSSIAIGSGAVAGGFNSTAIGWRASAPNSYTIVLGAIPAIPQGEWTDIAIGTEAPQGPLHIFRSDATQEMLILESDAAGGPQDRAMMDLSNNGGIRFQFANNTLGTAWRFQAATGNQDRFEVTKVGTGQIEFWVDDIGNGFIAGDLDVGGNLLTNVLLPSDARRKQDIEPIDPATVLDKVAALPLNSWAYTDRPGERHIGPMAQDFHQAFGLGRDDTSISMVDASGVALASIQALNDKLERQNRALAARNADLEKRLANLEALVAGALLPAARH